MTAEITVATSDNDLEQILDLQRKNLSENITQEIAANQGFVTVKHTLDLLRKMNALTPQTIAKAGTALVGYALVMTKQFRADIPVLEPMFTKLAHIAFDGKAISKYDFYVMGQICIDGAHRGTGIFDALYSGQRKQLAGRYELCVTEVAARNIRSLKAHQRVGFRSVLEYTAPNGETWHVLVWDWRDTPTSA